MSSEFDEIKNIFEDVLDDKAHIASISIKDNNSKKEYINNIYQYITTSEFGSMREDIISYLKINQTNFDNFILKMICTNLYCDFSIIYQILCSKGIKHEHFLAMMGVFEPDNKKIVERFRKRLKPDRLISKTQLALPNEFGYKYYIPTVLKAYKDTLLIKRTGTDIFDISGIFTDIFFALFFDSNQQLDDEIYTKNLRDVKAYRLWNFSIDTITLILNIYKSVQKNKNERNRFAEFILLEKLFGLKTISIMLSRDFNDKESLQIADSLSPLIPFGYNSFTEKIITDINITNSKIYGNIIRQYIQPLVLRCSNIILNDYIDYIGRIGKENREVLLQKFLSTCYNIANPIEDLPFSKNILATNKTLKLFKRFFDVPSKKIDLDYISSTNGFFQDYTHDKKNKPTDKSFVFDRGYTDLIYRKRLCDFSISDEEICEKFKKNNRIIY